MSILQPSTLLPRISFGHAPKADSVTLNGKLQTVSQQLCSKSSLANLVNIAKHPVENVVDSLDTWWDGYTKEQRARKQYFDQKRQILYLRLREASNYEDWQVAATALDNIEGNNDWKSVPESPDYNANLVAVRLKQMDEARISCDIGRMLFLLRTSLSRGLGDMGNLKLYKHTHIGTKDLIERYITSTLSTLKALLDVSAKAKCDGMESKYILEQVLSSRQAFGRSALLLSGGATFGMNHTGVLKALWEARLLPRIISGASAGSIVCAVLCTRTEEEMPELFATFCDGDLAVFEEEGKEETLLRKATRFLKFGALFDISHLIRVMRDLLGEMTFQEAYNRTRKILNICVSSASLYELPRLLNYITAPNVLIWSAVAASCSVPLVFSAATILAKDPKTGEAVPWNPSPQRWIDGSVDNDLPMTRLAELFNVNHFIVSQVNPHVVPFLVKEEDSITHEARQGRGTVAAGPSWLDSAAQLAKSEALHRMHTLAEVGIFPNTLGKVVSVLSQKYSGDITIMPEISYADFPRILANPTPEFMHQAMLCGERATWPKLSRIKNHCAIELALDDAVQQLRARVVFSPSQVDLRLGHCRSNSDSKKSSSRRMSKIRKRPLSYADASDPIQKHRAAKTSPPKKSLSINTVLSPPHPSTAPLRTTANLLLHDLTSSGAETSTLPTSASSSSFCYSSPTESPSSPRSPTREEATYTQSQPSSPSLSHRKLPSFLRSPTPPAAATMALGALSMTPRDPTAAPEARYQRLFRRKMEGGGDGG
ncbi:MAG: hypothetical protein Q9195_003060 [Heterodermia aff. obscurata]